jgi:hypothetical protein
MPTTHRHRLMLTILAGTVFVGCGSSAGGPTGPSEPTPTVLRVDNRVPGLSYFRQDVNVIRSGTMSATLRWADSRKDVDLALTSDSCQWDRGSCTILAKSDRSSGTREEISAPVSGGQNYRLWILNYASNPEDFNLEMVFQ